MSIIKKKQKSYWFGIIAEYYVILILFFKGYKLLERRYKTKLGEIDLIFKNGDCLVAVEVKARSGNNYQAGEVVYRKQFYRILNSLKIFLNKNEVYYNLNIRIDTVLVYKNLKIEHIKNIWTE